MQKRTMKNTFPDKGESYIPVCVLVLFLSALVSVLILYIGTMAQVQAQKRDVKTKLDSVVWNDELDLSCDELWEHGMQVHTPFDGLIAFSDATELWGLNESTLRKAISYFPKLQML